MYFCSFNSNCYNSVLQMYKSRVFIGRHNSALPVTAAVISAVSDSNTPETAITILAYLRYAAILTILLIRKCLILVCFLLTGNAEKYLSGWLLYFIYQEIQYKSASSVRNVPFCCVFNEGVHTSWKTAAHICVYINQFYMFRFICGA